MVIDYPRYGNHLPFGVIGSVDGSSLVDRPSLQELICYAVRLGATWDSKGNKYPFPLQSVPHTDRSVAE